VVQLICLHVQALGTGDTTIMTSGDPDPALAVTYGAITINDESTTLSNW
jgi:hypothetical protein